MECTCKGTSLSESRALKIIKRERKRWNTLWPIKKTLNVSCIKVKFFFFKGLLLTHIIEVSHVPRLIVFSVISCIFFSQNKFTTSFMAPLKGTCVTLIFNFHQVTVPSCLLLILILKVNVFSLPKMHIDSLENSVVKDHV